MNSVIHEVFGSKNRLKILTYLAEKEEGNISHIGYECGINYTSTNRHLETLLKSGLIKEKRYGKIRMFESRFNGLELCIIEGEGIILEVTEKPGESIVLGVPVPVEIYIKRVENKTGYPLTVSSKLRAVVKHRDKHRCVICGKTELQHLEEYNQDLTIHHVNEIRSENHKDNLVTLCKKCHVRIHKQSTKEELINRVKDHLKS